MGNKSKKRGKKGKSQAEAFGVTVRRNHFQCFCCQDRDLSLHDFEMYVHQNLRIAMCDSCYTPHTNDGEWHTGKDWEDRDPNGKTIFCEICAEGGTLLPCDECEKSYCTEKCLPYFMKKEALEEVLDDDQAEFCCFSCVKDNDDLDLHKTFPNYLKFLKATKRYTENQKQIRDSQEDEELNSRSCSKKFTCFACFSNQAMTKRHPPRLHKKFKVALCHDCADYLDEEHKSGDWTYTDGKSDYDVITGGDAGGDDGGELFLCDGDGCDSAFVKSTLINWMGEEAFEELEADDECEFLCPLCNPNCGYYQEFLTKTGKYLTAFEDDEEFEVTNSYDKKLIQEHEDRRARKAQRAAREKNSRRKSGRKRKISVSESSDEDAPVTRKIEKKSYDESDVTEESDPEIDYATNTPPKKDEPPTEAEAKEYLKKRMPSAIASRYHETKWYKKLMKVLE